MPKSIQYLSHRRKRQLISLNQISNVSNECLIENLPLSLASVVTVKSETCNSATEQIACEIATDNTELTNRIAQELTFNVEDVETNNICNDNVEQWSNRNDYFFLMYK